VAVDSSVEGGGFTRDLDDDRGGFSNTIEW